MAGIMGLSPFASLPSNMPGKTKERFAVDEEYVLLRQVRANESMVRAARLIYRDDQPFASLLDSQTGRPYEPPQLQALDKNSLQLVQPGDVARQPRLFLASISVCWPAQLKDSNAARSSGAFPNWM
jgi:hypothetical protein